MVDVHYFIFILNADTALFASLIFALAFVALRMVYKMWKSNLKCPHCGEPLRSHGVPSPPPPDIRQTPPLPNSLWT